MHTPSQNLHILNPELLLQAYKIGVFPMADKDKPDNILWIEPFRRGIISLSSAHVPRRVWRYIRAAKLKILFNQPDANIIKACATSTSSRPDTWINDTIISTYTHLFHQGHCHTITLYNEDNHLVGGLYGIAMGSVFFGESMVSFEPRASQIALVALLVRMKKAGLTLLDCQFTTHHLEKFGCISLLHEDYLALLRDNLDQNGDDPSLFMRNYHRDELTDTTLSFSFSSPAPASAPASAPRTKNPPKKTSKGTPERNRQNRSKT